MIHKKAKYRFATTFEDALLMGCGEEQLRDYLTQLVAGVDNPYRKS